MRLRRAGAGDAYALSVVGTATFIESFANDHDWVQVAEFLRATHSEGWWADALGDPANAVWLVEEAVGCPVGYAMAQPAALPGCDAQRDRELKRIYVLSKWHGGGWGSRLFESVEADARGRGAERLVLSVYTSNTPAQRFYRARGFEEIGRWLFEGFDASEDYIYAKPLAPPA